MYFIGKVEIVTSSRLSLCCFFNVGCFSSATRIGLF